MKYWLCFLLILVFCVGCQPNPEMEPVVNKGDGTMIEIIMEDHNDKEPRNNGSKTETYALEKVPGYLTNHFTPAKGLDVYIDAEILVPELNNIPVIEIVPDEITDAEMSAYLSALLGDAPIYAHDNTLTKEQIEVLLVVEQEELTNPDSYLNQSRILHGEKEYQRGLAAVKETIDDLKRLWETAPEEVQLKRLERRCYKQEGATYIKELRGRTILPNGCSGDVNFQKMAPYTWQRFEVLHPLDGYGYPSSAYSQSALKVPKPNITETEAITLATDLLEEMELKGVFHLSQIASSYRANLLGDDMLQCYMLYFERLYAGIPSLFCSEISDNVQRYRAEWPYEMLCVGVGEQGVVYFEWISPVKINRILNEDVTILPFEDIMERFEKNIAYSYIPIDQNVSSRELHIDRIDFGYTRIAMIHQENVGMLVPSWSFYGYEIDYYDSQKDTQWVLSEDNSVQRDDVPVHRFLTLNALDGSVIDFNQGF